MTNASLRSQSFSWEFQEEKEIDNAENPKCSKRVKHKYNDADKEENFQEVVVREFLN